MRIVLAASVALGLLAGGCSWIVPIEAPEPTTSASPGPPPPVASETLPPRPARTPSEAPPAVVPSAPVAPPAPPSASLAPRPPATPLASAPGPVEPPPAPPPVVAARVPNEDRVVEQINTSLAKIQKIIGKIDGSKLNRDQREIFTSIQDFLAKAQKAYQAKDMSRAQVLTEKASKLADNLAETIRQ
jgi:hypothetical protein